MESKTSYRRKNYFINKAFQVDFTIRFILLIVLAACVALALFLFFSKNTITAGYSGLEVKVLHTTDFFLPILLVSTVSVIILTGIIAIIILIYLSHRIAGPIYRFEQVLDAIDNGDLTFRFTLRKNDQFKELAARINALAETMDGKISGIKAQTVDIAHLVEDLRKSSASHAASSKEFEEPLREIARKLSELHDAADHFKTSQDN